MAGSSRKDFECITSGYPSRDYHVWLSKFFVKKKKKEKASVFRKLFFWAKYFMLGKFFERKKKKGVGGVGGIYSFWSNCKVFYTQQIFFIEKKKGFRLGAFFFFRKCEIYSLINFIKLQSILYLANFFKKKKKASVFGELFFFFR